MQVATIFKNIKESMQRWKIVINLMVYSMLSIMITPFMDALQEYINTGVFDAESIVDVSKFILAPFFMLIAFKQIISELSSENKKNADDLIEAQNKVKKLEDDLSNLKTTYELKEQHDQFKHEVLIEQIKGTIGIKDYEIDRLNKEIDRLKAELKLAQNGIVHKGGVSK